MLTQFLTNMTAAHLKQQFTMYSAISRGQQGLKAHLLVSSTYLGILADDTLGVQAASSHILWYGS